MKEKAFSCLKNIPMSTLTTFRIGGLCDALYRPQGIEETVQLLQDLDEKIILGKGSNVLVSDDGLRTPVVQMGGINHMVFEEDSVRAGCGVSLPELAREAARKGLSGLEWAAGIPGSVGGGVVMNAGAYDGEMSQVVKQVLIFDGQEVQEISRFDFAYRHSIFLQNPNHIVLEATLQLIPDEVLKIRARMDKWKAARDEKQPVTLPSGGSFFKRPPKAFAAALIDKCGLRGATVGGAQISLKHAGFLVNKGGATCQDVLELAKMVRCRVAEETGFLLEPEVRLLAEFSWEDVWNF